MSILGSIVDSCLDPIQIGDVLVGFIGMEKETGIVTEISDGGVLLKRKHGNLFYALATHDSKTKLMVLKEFTKGKYESV